MVDYGDRVELNGQFCLQMPCDLVEIAEKEFTVFSMNKLNESLEIIRSMIDDYLNQNKNFKINNPYLNEEI